MEWDNEKICPSIIIHVLVGVLCSVRRCRAGRNTRADQSIHNEDISQRYIYRNRLLMVDEDQSNCISAFITGNAAKVV